MTYGRTQRLGTDSPSGAYDYVKNDLEETQKEGPQPDMWRDWSQALRNA